MSKTTETDAGETPDFTALAFAYQEKRKCSWQQATLAIKRKFPEARAYFMAKHADDAKLRGALASS